MITIVGSRRAPDTDIPSDFSWQVPSWLPEVAGGLVEANILAILDFIANKNERKAIARLGTLSIVLCTAEKTVRAAVDRLRLSSFLTPTGRTSKRSKEYLVVMPEDRAEARYMQRSDQALWSVEDIDIATLEGLRRSAIESLKALPYAEYLRTDHWRGLRKQKLKQADHQCQYCSAKIQLEVHHRTYERIGHEYLSDLTVVCRNCHRNLHAREARHA